MLFIAILFIGCKSNPFLHNDITDKNFSAVVQHINKKEHDTLWLTPKTVCVKKGLHHLKIGSVINGREKGKWFHYYTVNRDTIYCYYIEKFRKKDTLVILNSSHNITSW